MKSSLILIFLLMVALLNDAKSKDVEVTSLCKNIQNRDFEALQKQLESEDFDSYNSSPLVNQAVESLSENERQQVIKLLKISNERFLKKNYPRAEEFQTLGVEMSKLSEEDFIKKINLTKDVGSIINKKKQTLLILAAMNGHGVKILDALINAGVNIDAADVYGNTALMCAVIYPDQHAAPK